MWFDDGSGIMGRSKRGEADHIQVGGPFTGFGHQAGYGRVSQETIVPSHRYLPLWRQLALQLRLTSSTDHRTTKQP